MYGLELYVPSWELPPGVQAAVTMRDGGISDGKYSNFNLSRNVGDEEVAVSENRMRLQTALAGAPELAWIKQVHSDRVVSAEQALNEQGGCECDAVWTDRRNLACLVTSADCLPVLLAATDGSKVAAIHAGWRGLEAKVIKEACRIFPDVSFTAFIGPGISAANYEVKDDVRDRLLAANCPEKAFSPSGQGGYQADLALIASAQLEELGAVEVEVADVCTYANRKRFFSARRDGPLSGRFASAIWINELAAEKVQH